MSKDIFKARNIPANYKRITLAHSYADVVHKPFGYANVILFPRQLSGDFNALAQSLADRHVEPTQGWAMIGRVAVQDFLTSHHAAAVEQAAAQVRDDMAMIENLTGGAFEVNLRVLGPDGYNDQGKILGVHDYHNDGEHNPDKDHGRILCSYNPPVTQGLRNSDAKLLNFQESTGSGFYKPKKGAKPFEFLPGDLWRQHTGNAMQEKSSLKRLYDYYIGSRSESYKPPSYIHRAMKADGKNARLLLDGGLL